MERILRLANAKRVAKTALASLIVLAAGGCAPTVAGDAAPESPERLFIVGQDLDSVRGYLASGCCPAPDGITTYMTLYNLLSEAADFGGIGLDAAGRPIDRDADWGAGPSNAVTSATEFATGRLVIGLFIAENSHPGGLAEVIAGQRDAEIRQLARLFEHVGGTVYLRIGYEFDGRWNAGVEHPETYKAAYRHIIDVLRAEGVGNVTYVWHAAASPIDDILDQAHEDIRRWYPGDDYVDWMALSWFLLPEEGPRVNAGYRPATQRELADEVVRFARERGKPVMVAEAAPQGYDLAALSSRHISRIWDGPTGKGRKKHAADDIWRAWYAPLFAYLEENGDVIRALAYINCHWDSQDMWDAPYEGGYWGDSRLQVNAEIAERWSAAIEGWRGDR